MGGTHMHAFGCRPSAAHVASTSPSHSVACSKATKPDSSDCSRTHHPPTGARPPVRGAVARAAMRPCSCQGSGSDDQRMDVEPAVLDLCELSGIPDKAHKGYLLRAICLVSLAVGAPRGCPDSDRRLHLHRSPGRWLGSFGYECVSDWLNIRVDEATTGD